jgi:hypothetical protein
VDAKAGWVVRTGRDNQMQMTRTRTVFKLGVETAAVALNAALAFCLYEANLIFSYSSLLKTNLAVASQWAFMLGLVGVALVVILRQKARGFLVRFALLVTITLFNQMCVTAFLISMLPFGGKVLQAPRP